MSPDPISPTMSTRKADPASKYHAALTLLAESAEHDRAHALSIILESAASAISLDLVHDLSNRCMEFWRERGQSPEGGTDATPRPRRSPRRRVGANDAPPSTGRRGKGRRPSTP